MNLRCCVFLTLTSCAAQAEISSQESAVVCGDDDIEYLGHYDDDLNHLDVTYDLIERRAGAVGTLVCPSTELIFCSGTLITPDLFLTVAHCIDNAFCPDDFEDWQVLFKYRLDGRPTPSSFADLHPFNSWEWPIVMGSQQGDLWPVEAVEELGHPTHATAPDYAILRLSGAPGLEYGVTPVRDRDVDLQEPVFLMGHPDLAGEPFADSEPISITAGRVTIQEHLEPGFVPVFGHTIDSWPGTSGSGVLDADGYLVGVHSTTGCDTGLNANLAQPIAELFDVSPILNGQTGGPGLSIPYNEDRMLVSTFNSSGVHTGNTLVSFDSYSPSYENAEAQAVAYTTLNQVRLAGSVSRDHSEHFAAVAQVSGKFTLNRFVLNTPAVGLGGDDERFLDMKVAYTLLGAEAGLVAVGHVKNGADRQVLVAAVKPDASGLIPQFGTGGFTITDVPDMTDEVATAVHPRSSIETYVAGNGILPSGRRGIFVTRYDSSGAVDTSFGSGGFVHYDSGGEAAVVEAMLEWGGNLYLAGHTRHKRWTKRHIADADGANERVHQAGRHLSRVGLYPTD